MIKVKMMATGKIVEVTRNVAHGLVEQGKAIVVSTTGYLNRQMKASRKLRVKKPRIRQKK